MKNIIRIIGKFNVATLALFTAIYIACLVLVLIAVNPKHTYEISPNYDHHSEYSDIANSYQVTFKRAIVSGKIEESYSIRMALNSRTSFEDKTDKNYEIIKYQAEIMQENGQEYYFGEVSGGSTPWARSTSLGEGHTPKTFYSRLKYLNSDNEEINITLKEEMFDTPKKLDNYKEGNVIKFGDTQFIYQAIATKDGEDYNVSMRMVSTVNDAFHIDLQSWILTNDNKLLPFAGAYGLNNGTWNSTNEKVIKEVNPKAIVCKVICYYKDEAFEMHYMANIDSLKPVYSEFENIDAEKIQITNYNKINKIIAIVAISATFICIITVIVICVIRSKKKKEIINS